MGPRAIEGRGVRDGDRWKAICVTEVVGEGGTRARWSEVSEG